MPVCAACKQRSPEGFRFCGACGVELPAEHLHALEARRTVTVLFADVTGSTALGERLDPESLRRVMGRYFGEMSAVLERHGGTVEKFIGDAIMAVFGIPVLHEDDGLRTVRAAAEMRERLSALNDGLERDYGVRIEQRIGINTGEVVAGDAAAGQRLATGDAVNVAARLEQAAAPGEILIGEATRSLVRDAVVVEPIEPIEAKGKRAPVVAWHLASVSSVGPAFERRLEASLVGRRRELELLRHALGRAVDDCASHIFTVLGPAGIGKSRLVQELTDSVTGEARVLIGHCLPYGDGITYWPLHDVFHAAGADDELEHILAATAPEECFRRARLAFERFAAERPLVVVLDDLHWAEPTFLDFVEHVADWTRDAPILLVCIARPELLDERPAWGGGKLNATSLLLEPLSADESVTLVAQLRNATPLDEALERRIVEASEGNPLFVEEMLATVTEDGDALRSDVPSTIQALIAARLDRLSGAEQVVAAAAAVEGRTFHHGAVLELVPDELRLDAAAHLQALARKDLIRPEPAELPGESGSRFRHLLIRDAAYQSLPKEERARLHERFAGWLERAAAGRAREYEEIVGYHLEQSTRYRAELGPPDESTLALARRASAHLAASGDRAAMRRDDPASVKLFRRAIALVPEGTPEWLDLAPTLVNALVSTADFAEAQATLARGLAAAADDARADARLRLARVRLVGYVDPTTPMSELLAEVEAITAVLETRGDERALAAAWFEHGKLTLWLGSAERSQASFERSSGLARHAGDRALEIAALSWNTASMLIGPVPVDEAEASTRDALARLEEHPAAVMALLSHGILLAMRGRCDEARRRREEARATDSSFGRLAHHVHFQFGGQIELLCGDAETAAAVLAAGCEQSLRSGETSLRSSTSALLGDALYRLGCDDEALDATEVSERHATRDDLEAQAHWRSVAAKVHARRGDPERAERLAREAVEIVEGTDWLHERGAARLALAVVLRADGRVTEAAVEARRALDLFERKGDVVSAGEARELLAELDGS